MAIQQMKVREVVDQAVDHRWSIPEFQRGFVWRASKVRDLAESLWRQYPIGSFLLWRSPVEVEPRVATDNKQPDSWVVDGQQRTTALALLFLADHRDEYFRLLLTYLIAYGREAHDWKNGTRLGFEGKDLLTGFSPDWHHIFPRKYLENNGVEGGKIHALANMAVIDPKTNIRFGAKEPTRYLDKYEIPDKYLKEQFVPTDRKLFAIDRFDEFLKLRARLLAGAANEYFQRLRDTSS